MMGKWLFLLGSLLILSGCAGKEEIDDLALVMAVGIDQAKDDGVEVSIEVARPADARGQTGAPAGNTGDPIWSASSEGKTIFEAIRNLSNFSTRRVFWAHNFIIVINEKVAQEKGIADIIDFFTRNPELRMRTWVVVTPDSAKDVITTMTGLEILPGEAMDKLFRYSDISNAAPRSEMKDVQAAYLSDTTEPFMARLKLVDRGVSDKKKGQAGSFKQIELAGTGVFKDDHLVGVLSKSETKGFLPFVQKVTSGVFVLPCSADPDQKLTAEMDYERFEVKPTYKNGKPAFVVDAKIYLNIVEAGCPFSIENKQEVNRLEKEIEGRMTATIERVLEKSQKEFKSDFLELGRQFNNRYPAEWKQFKGKWETVYPEAAISVKVDADVKSGVLLFNPTKSGKN